MPSFARQSAFTAFALLAMGIFSAGFAAEGSASAQELGAQFFNSFTKKDADGIMSLYYLDDVDQALQDNLKRGTLKRFSIGTPTAFKIIPLLPGYKESFERNGERYAISLPPKGMFEISMALPDNKSWASQVPFGEKDGKFYLLTFKQVP